MGCRLVGEGVITQGESDGWVAEFEKFLDQEFDAGKAYMAGIDGAWSSTDKANYFRIFKLTPKQAKRQEKQLT